jgi:hypothetical protein
MESVRLTDRRMDELLAKFAEGKQPPMPVAIRRKP